MKPHRGNPALILQILKLNAIYTGGTQWNSVYCKYHQAECRLFLSVSLVFLRVFNQHPLIPHNQNPVNQLWLFSWLSPLKTLNPSSLSYKSPDDFSPHVKLLKRSEKSKMRQRAFSVLFHLFVLSGRWVTGFIGPRCHSCQSLEGFYCYSFVTFSSEPVWLVLNIILNKAKLLQAFTK